MVDAGVIAGVVVVVNDVGPVATIVAVVAEATGVILAVRASVVTLAVE